MAVTNTADRLVLELPETPSLNQMIDLAKQRARIGRKVIPIVYDRHKQAYETLVLATLRKAGHGPPIAPWATWRIDSVGFRLHNRRDPLELLAGLKWAVDALVKGGYVANDSARELVSIPLPTQKIDRANRGVTLSISRP